MGMLTQMYTRAHSSKPINPQTNLTLRQFTVTDSSEGTKVLHRQLQKDTATPASGAAVAASVLQPSAGVSALIP